jgi:hypothetical protein
MLPGLLIALIAAVGWGIEGAVAGYGTVLIDYQIGITIRQLTSGILNLGLFVPVLCLIAGDNGLYGALLGGALGDGGALALFAVSGLFCFLSFGLWYRGNSMCGTALGMACNGSYSFWTPLFCWLVLGLGFGWAGQAVAPVVWVAAPVLFVGLVLVALNPLELLRWKDGLFQDIEVVPVGALPASGGGGLGGSPGSGTASDGDLAVADAAGSGRAGPDGAGSGGFGSGRVGMDRAGSDGAGSGGFGLGGAGSDGAGPGRFGSGRAGSGVAALSGRDRMLPLNYAVLRWVAVHGEADADLLVDALSAGYAGRRVFRRPLIAEALAAAEKNGVLEIASVGLSPAGEVAVRYRPTATGQAMIERFIGRQSEFAAAR